MSGLVIIPTYKEKENIEAVIKAISALPVKFDILIIDDNSPDGTADIVKKLQESYSNLHLVERPGKMGLGTAYLSGFDWALSNGYYNACFKDGADLAIGSRYISGVNVVDWPLTRVLMSYSASIYVRMVTGMKIMDTTAGFKCYKSKVLKDIRKYKIRSVGYGFQIEMKFTAWKLGYKIVEVPIIFTDRKHGISKMSGGIFNEAFWGVLRMKFRSFFTKYQKS